MVRSGGKICKYSSHVGVSCCQSFYIYMAGVAQVSVVLNLLIRIICLDVSGDHAASFFGV